MSISVREIDGFLLPGGPVWWMVFEHWLCLCSGLLCPAANGLPEGHTSLYGRILQDVPEPKSSLAHCSAAVPAEVKYRVSHKAQTPVGFRRGDSNVCICVCMIFWPEYFTVWSRLYSQKNLFGIIVVIATPWSDAVSLFYLSRSLILLLTVISQEKPLITRPWMYCKCFIYPPPPQQTLFVPQPIWLLYLNT